MFDALRADIHHLIERHRNRPFLRAVMAACATVATADGEVSFAERVRLDQILETLDKLRVFDPHEGVELFRAFAEEILAHPAEGRQQALEAIQAATAGSDAQDIRNLLVRVCMAVSEANGETKLVDQIEIVTLCGQLGIDPRDCGLYIDRPPEDLLSR